LQKGWSPSNLTRRWPNWGAIQAAQLRHGSWLNRRGLNCKKTLDAVEQSRLVVAEQRRQWPQRLAGVPAERLVFLAES